MAKEYRALLKRAAHGEPASVAEYEAVGGFRGLRRAVTLGEEGVLEELKTSVLAGRGGAGFPTGKKWEMVYREEEPEKYVVCNADEGEAGAFKDRALLSQVPLRVLEGMIIAGYVLHAQRGYIYLRGEYRGLLPLLLEALEGARRAGYLGDGILGRFSFDITVICGAGAYLCGEETALLESIEGRRGEPRRRPPYPTQAGLYGKPTLVNNVETIANVPLILDEGAKEYSRHATKLVCLSGSVKRRGIYEVILGSVTIDELIHGENFGGGMAEGQKAAFFQVGGQSAAMGFPEQIYTPFNYREMAVAGLGIGCGAIVVADGQASLIGYCRNILRFFINESCGKCIPCRNGLPVLAELLERLDNGKGKKGDVERLEGLVEQIGSLSGCGLGQAACAALKSSLIHRRAAFAAGIQGGV